MTQPSTGTARPFSQYVMAVALLIGLSGQAQPSYSSSQLYDDDTVFSPELSRVRTLVKANVLNLAQFILETEGPSNVPNKTWLNWERQLWKLYRLREDWQALYQRSRQIPPAFPESIRKEADVQAIYALINLRDGKRARSLLRKQLLSNDLLEFEKREFRKLLIESYLADDLLGEAGVAMESYQADFQSEKEDWLLLRAKVYLKRNHADFAANLLSSIKIPAARLLRLFAALKNQSLQPEQAIHQAKKLLSKPESLAVRNTVKAYQVLAVIIYAKNANNKWSSAVDELEQYLIAVSAGVGEVDNIYPRYNVADLLAAYRATALAEAAQAELLEDDNASWLDYVSRLPATALAQKKAIYGFLLQASQDEFSRQQLNDLFVTSLIQSKRIEVISQLYGVGKPFGRLALSGDVNLELSNAALVAGNIRLAAEVNRIFAGIPHGMARIDWLLRTVRISILAGDYDKGYNDLMLWIDEFEQLGAEQTDRVLQPIFDLQTANQHKLALKLLYEVNGRVQSVKQKREIAYWIAESYQATRQYIKAADYFLFSALQKDNGFDPWGEAARYSAAEALLAANLVADSRVLFEGLLVRATTDNRKTQLQQKLQQLWLHESSLKNAN